MSPLVSFIPVHIPVRVQMGKTDKLCAFDRLNWAGRGSLGHSGAELGGRQDSTALSALSPCWGMGESCFPLVSLGGD